jgi:dephospho-CoA kinase
MAKQNVFDFVIWVDRSKHLPLESKDSMSLAEHIADFVIDNNGSLDELYLAVDEVVEEIIIR